MARPIPRSSRSRAARGIGLAIAEALRAGGAQVSIGDVDVALAREGARRLSRIDRKARAGNQNRIGKLAGKAKA